MRIKILTWGGMLIVLAMLVHFTSYGNANIIEHRESDFGPIWVYDRNSTRCISFVPPGSIVQTCISLEAPDKMMFEYYKLIMGSLYINVDPKKLLVIGLGGGVLPMSFAKILPNAEIEVVEINQTVAELAKQYFSFSESKNLKLTIQDATEFIKNKNNIYDIIVLDAFDAEYIPPPILTEEFFKNIKNALTANGVLAVNSFRDTKYIKIETDLFNNNFDYILNLKGSHNQVILASKSALPKMSAIKERSKLLERDFTNFGISTNWLIGKFEK
jgi:spermidine synthase